MDLGKHKWELKSKAQTLRLEREGGLFYVAVDEFLPIGPSEKEPIIVFGGPTLVIPTEMVGASLAQGSEEEQFASVPLHEATSLPRPQTVPGGPTNAERTLHV